MSQGLKVVARQAAQIVQAGRRFQNLKALPALPVKGLKGFDEFAPRKRFRLFVPKTHNHIKQLISNGRYTSSVHFLSLESPFFAIHESVNPATLAPGVRWAKIPPLPETMGGEMRRPTIATMDNGLPVQCLSERDFLFPDADEKYVPEVLAYIQSYDFKTFNPAFAG